MPKPDVTARTLQALGHLLEDNYGRYEDDQTMARNYATLWDTVLDALKGGTLDREMLDAEYIKIAMREDVG